MSIMHYSANSFFSFLKLICQLTGDTINKSEEHIWKHINGKRFLNMLDKKEAEKETGGKGEEQSTDRKPKEDIVKEKKRKEKKKAEKKKEKDKDRGKANNNEVMIFSSDKECDSENGDFWMPPAGERWDMDDGGDDRWGSDSDSDSDSDSELESDEEISNGVDVAAVDEESKDEATELSTRTKRMSIEIGPSRFASRKKKKKTEA